MSYIIKAQEKHSAYSSAGYTCSAISEEDNKAIFISEKNGAKRIHTFTNDGSTIDIIRPEVISKEKNVEIQEVVESEKSTESPIVGIVTAVKEFVTGQSKTKGRKKKGS